MLSRLRIRYISDIHLEFHLKENVAKILQKITPDLSPATVCVCAGDICDPFDERYDTFMRYMSTNFTKTFVIAGNHEYYSQMKKIDETEKHLKEYFAKFSNISYLQNESELYLGHWFIGTTLWSKITNPKFEINDVHYIPKFCYLKYNRLNMLAADFLQQELAEKENCVVITHHLPSEDLIDVKYKTNKMRPYNQWFASDLSSLFNPNVKLWVYGHTHEPNIQQINGVQFICNPIGYPKERTNINYNLHYDIEAVDADQI